MGFDATDERMCVVVGCSFLLLSVPPCLVPCRAVPSRLSAGGRAGQDAREGGAGQPELPGGVRRGGLQQDARHLQVKVVANLLARTGAFVSAQLASKEHVCASFKSALILQSCPLCCLAGTLDCFCVFKPVLCFFFS